MELHDIFYEVPIIEYSLYSFIAIILVGIILLSTFYKYLKDRLNKVHPLHILEHYNPNDAKQTAYQISYYGKKLAKSDTQKQYLATLEIKLDLYKYLKTPQSLSTELQENVEMFIQMLKAKHV